MAMVSCPIALCRCHKSVLACKLFNMGYVLTRQSRYRRKYLWRSLRAAASAGVLGATNTFFCFSKVSLNILMALYSPAIAFPSRRTAGPVSERFRSDKNTLIRSNDTSERLPACVSGGSTEAASPRENTSGSTGGVRSDERVSELNFGRFSVCLSDRVGREVLAASF